MSLFQYLDPIEPFERNLAKYFPYGGHVIPGKGTLHPKIDVHETDKETIIHAEIPGIKKEDVKVTAVQDGNSLVLSGFSKREDVKEGSLLIHERHFGSFDRTIKLPMGSEPDKTKAKFENGLLTINVPKGDKKSCSKIEIE
ncbi:hypothetical protein DSO57_1026429 [Entomophthora muscae]|uniref:Uncharacterized protein n=1 Tax=Entomophthora muscae TaxID=34485 RepID=A0ACC2S428_9FUNG|nr:hypothetical protein DSO57_1026429 [Entomophthora muscae]